MTKATLEERSSAITLSDMEIFIFPDLMYSLVLANIMSPRVWLWRDDPWFDGIERMTPYRRIVRLKQYLMDHYAFNLDLDTWGLTTKQREISRFAPFIDSATLAESNALFGYEGDKYYFDIDIRRHFGLDKYDTDTIPYWKTETVEAMDAFRHRPGYSTGAGECVSLSTLYAAALFIVARIPLNDIFLLATPLHSQNFVDVDDGVLTNNRRIVTKNMWFNGTALSAQARRALENERVTVVAHESGHVHTLYPEATMDRAAYNRFSAKLSGFLATDLTADTLGNFLRHNTSIQKCFQVRWPRHGADSYIGVEQVLAYENSCPYRLSDRTRPKLMQEVESEEFSPNPLASRIVLNDLEDFLRTEKISILDGPGTARLKERFATSCLNAEIAIESLRRFCVTRPRLPDTAGKTFAPSSTPLGLDVEMTREEVIERLGSLRDRSRTADLSFYAFRDVLSTDAAPFVTAACARSPVSLTATADMDLPDVLEKLAQMPGDSIYDGKGRLAQPDEVWNFGRGDGVEKALLLANILHNRRPDEKVGITCNGNKVLVSSPAGEYHFESAKGMAGAEWVVEPEA